MEFQLLYLPDEDRIHRKIFEVCMTFLGVGFIFGLSALAQTYWFSKAGVNFVSKLRYVYSHC